MDRKAYKLPFTKRSFSRWLCPTCNEGILKFRKDTFHAEETETSKLLRTHPEWDVNWIEYVYSCLLECINPTCKDIVANSGTGGGRG